MMRNRTLGSATKRDLSKVSDGMITVWACTRASFETDGVKDSDVPFTLVTAIMRARGRTEDKMAPAFSSLEWGAEAN